MSSEPSSFRSETLYKVLQTLVIGGTYIPISAGLITFNKYLVHPGRFPHPTALTAIHMLVTSSMALLLYAICPQFYPSMEKARKEILTLVKYLVPLACCFALALYCSNAAYLYCTVAFLQFCKEGNVPLMFCMACFVGLQQFSVHKVIVIGIIIAGCSMCVHGEVQFSWLGFALQIASQFAEVTKNLIGEIVLTGAGLKLDVLTFVTFQAPLSLVPLSIATCYSWTPQMTEDFMRTWQLLLCNALLAFLLNVMIALTLKNLSGLAFVIIGIVKDIFIVASSAAVFGDSISPMQQIGFIVTIVGIASWGHLKIQEQEQQVKSSKESCEATETEPLVAKSDKKIESA